MPISRTNPHQPILPRGVRIGDEPTSSPNPAAAHPEASSRASTGASAVAERAVRRSNVTEPGPVPDTTSRSAATTPRADARALYRREPGVALVLASFVVGLVALLVPETLERAAVVTAVGLLVVGVAMVVFLPAGATAGTNVRPLYRREPWLAAVYASVSVGITVGVVPPVLQRGIIVVSMSFLVLAVVLVVRQERSRGGAGERPHDDRRE